MIGRQLSSTLQECYSPKSSPVTEHGQFVLTPIQHGMYTPDDQVFVAQQIGMETC